MGKSIIIYYIIKFIYGNGDDVYISTAKHLKFQLLKQLQKYQRDDGEKRQEIRFNFNYQYTKYMIIDEYKPEDDSKIQRKYNKVFCLNCYFPKDIIPTYSYSIDDAIKDGYLCKYDKKEIKASDILKQEFNKGFIINNSPELKDFIKENQIGYFVAEDRYKYRDDPECKLKYITIYNIEGLSVPFIDAIFYNEKDLDEYQKIQILGRVIRKDNNRPDKIAHLISVL